jgi:hypothetical protein
MISDTSERTVLTSGSYVEWSAIIAGSVVALAVSFVLLTFGAAAGLSVVSPWSSSTATVVSASIGTALWMLLSYVWAFSLGGYLSGRLRHRVSSVQSEVEFRDGSHGLLVWALALTLTAMVAAFGLSNSNTATPASERQPVASVLDTLLRPVPQKPDTRTDDVRPQAARLLAQAQPIASISTPATTASRAQLVQLVAMRTGVPEAEADKRVSEASAEFQTITTRAKKMAVVLGFFTAAALLVAAAAAWAAAEIGGKHRDEGTLWAGFTRY